MQHATGHAVMPRLSRHRRQAPVSTHQCRPRLRKGEPPSGSRRPPAAGAKWERQGLSGRAPPPSGRAPHPSGRALQPTHRPLLDRVRRAAFARRHLDREHLQSRPAGAVGLRRRPSPSACAVGLRRRNAPSACAGQAIAWRHAVSLAPVRWQTCARRARVSAVRVHIPRSSARVPAQTRPGCAPIPAQTWPGCAPVPAQTWPECAPVPAQMWER